MFPTFGKQCIWCKNWKPENMYETHIWKCRELSELWCKDCKEKRRCHKCGIEKLETEFENIEWKRARALGTDRGKCMECTRNQDLRPCANCSWKNGRLPFKCFSRRMWRRDDSTRKCIECVAYVDGETRSCSNCNQKMTQTHFADYQWHKAADRRQCMKCSVGSNSKQKIGNWTCKRYNCKKNLPEAMFSIWKQQQAPNSQSRWKVCNMCLAYDKLQEDAQNLATNMQVQKSKQSEK